MLMTLVLFGLQLLPNLTIAGVVMLIGLVATLAESLLGALAQDRVAWLSVNGQCLADHPCCCAGDAGGGQTA